MRIVQILSFSVFVFALALPATSLGQGSFGPLTALPFPLQNVDQWIIGSSLVGSGIPLPFGGIPTVKIGTFTSQQIDTSVQRGASGQLSFDQIAKASFTVDSKTVTNIRLSGGTILAPAQFTDLPVQKGGPIVINALEVDSIIATVNVGSSTSGSMSIDCSTRSFSFCNFLKSPSVSLAINSAITGQTLTLANHVVVATFSQNFTKKRVGLKQFHISGVWSGTNGAPQATAGPYVITVGAVPWSLYKDKHLDLRSASRRFCVEFSAYSMGGSGQGHAIYCPDPSMIRENRFYTADYDCSNCTDETGHTERPLLAVQSGPSGNILVLVSFTINSATFTFNRFNDNTHLYPLGKAAIDLTLSERTYR